MSIQGLHHITLIADSAQRTADFYTRILGLRLVKTTVNADEPADHHLFFGDAEGAPGSILSFFIMPGARRGSSGIGGTHHYALTVRDGIALRKWKRWLTDNGVQVNGPLNRHYFESIYFRDPDRAIIELATSGPGFTVDEPAAELGTSDLEPPAELIRANRDQAAINADTHPEPVPAISNDMTLSRGLHHISAVSADILRTHDFYSGVLGLPLVKRTSNFDDPDSPHWYWTASEAGRTALTYLEVDPEKLPPARLGTGQTHHFAFSVAGEEELHDMGERLRYAGHQITQVSDHTYFRSIYSSDPDGHMIEIATNGPGFTVDEPLERLGQSLKLPAGLEGERQELERVLPQFTPPAWKTDDD